MGRWLRALLAAVAVVILASCQADVTIDLSVDEDGGGVVDFAVRFDDESTARLGDIAATLRVDDLERAGWRVDVDDAGEDTVVRAQRDVSSPGQWQAVLDQIAGPGVFNNVRVTTDDGFARASQRLDFDLDLREGWNLLSDEGVAAALDGEPFGAPLDTLTAGRSLDEIVSVDLSATVVSDDEAAAVTSTYAPRFDSSQRLTVQVESTSENATAQLLRWIAVALLSLFVLATVLAVAGIVLQRRADRLRPAPTPARLSSRVPGSVEPGAAAARSVPASAARRESVRLVVLEAVSVLYGQSSSAEAFLLEFVRERGASARADTIHDGYRSVLSGAMSTDAFWSLCGIEQPAAEVDASLVAARRLHAGAPGFFDEMQRRRIPVAAINDDAAVWSQQTRDRDRLSAVWPWLVSAEIGATRDNSAIFEVLRRESGVAFGHCLYVDTDVGTLDAARDLGMKTALFDTGDLTLPAVVGHPVVTDFKDLFSTTKS